MAVEGIVSREIQQPCEIVFGDFNQKADLNYIHNPAYVVKEPRAEEGRKEGVGCVVAWNRAFETLTNFVPNDIDNQSCFELIGGIKNEDGQWIKVCCGKCRFRMGVSEGRIERAGALTRIIHECRREAFETEASRGFSQARPT
ncbi:MAG: hypothetical protein AABZ34_19980 [Nitrospirota bacterium]